MDQERQLMFAATRNLHTELTPSQMGKSSLDVAAWQPSKVIEWFLNEVNLRDYEKVVRSAGIDGKQLRTLSDEQLRKIGMESAADRDIVLAHVQRLLHRCHLSRTISGGYA